jgi:hypothetical protein
MAFTVGPDDGRSLNRRMNVKATDFCKQLKRTQGMFAMNRLLDNGEQFVLQRTMVAFGPSPQPLDNIGGNVLD